MQDVYTHELETWRSRGALIVDVREAEEFTGGRIPQAINLPLSQIDVRLGELNASVDTEILLVCRSGNRSRNAGEYLEALGFKNLGNLLGGTSAWVQAGLELEMEAST
jgi:rhodanese-related sulfurtransferase